MPGQGQVSAAVKDVSGKAANNQLGAEKSELAMLENARHQSVSFGGDVQPDPDKRQLGVEPIKAKQQTAFGELIHANPSRPNVVELHPIYARTPEALAAGVPDVTGGTSSFYVK